MKLFDFGLARIMRDDGNASVSVAQNDSNDQGVTERGGLETDENAIYNMSGGTGTPRFMAPEVYMDLPYGAKVDVFSLSIVIWQVLSLLQPYGDVPASKFEETVIKGGLRPPINESWPSELKDMVSNMWSSDSARRPASKDVVTTLEILLRGSDDDLYPTSSLQRLVSGKEAD